MRFERTTSAFRHSRRTRHIIGTKTLGTKALRIADPYAMVLSVAGPVAQLDRALPSEGVRFPNLLIDTGLGHQRLPGIL